MRKFLLILCAVVCSVVSVSAQQSTESKKISKSFDLTFTYKSEVNVGFAVTGMRSKGVVASPNYGDEWGPEAGSLYAGDNTFITGVVNSIFSRPYIETIHGLQIGKYLFVGAGIGFQYYCGKLKDFQTYADIAALVKEKSKAAQRWNALMMPIFVDIKGMYPIKQDLVPFINLGLGGAAAFCSAINYKYEDAGLSAKMRMRGGLYCDFGGGIRWKQLSLSIGLQHQTIKLVDTQKSVATEYMPSSEIKTIMKIKTNAFNVKVGVCF